MDMILKNWAGNYEYSTSNVHYPETIEHLQTLVAHTQKLRVLGTRHSFNSLADSTENLVSLERCAPTISLQRERNTVSIGGAVTYSELCPLLHREGFALRNLASLPQITVAGACSTATHGSGVHNQNLAAAVSGLEVVTANGDRVTFSRERDADSFNGAVVSLGSLGVIVKLTLDLVPAFQMSQTAYETLPLQNLVDHFDEIMSSAYSVSLFTDWQQDTINQVWLKQRQPDGFSSDPVKPLPDFFGAMPATQRRHPIPGFPADTCTEQLGIPGPWFERLTHFRIGTTPSAGAELQSEYFLPREQAVAAIRAVTTLHQQIAPHLLISEIRCIAADDFWMSPCYRRDSVAIHFTWKPDWSAVSALLPKIEAQLAPFAVRPHWAKLFTLPPHKVQSGFEKLPAFKQLLQHYDPQGKFRNAFLDTVIPR